MSERTLCFYCEEKESVSIKYEQPCCDDCNTNMWSSNLNQYERQLDQRDLANRHKVLLKTFGGILK